MSDLSDADPRLTPLADNGGPTWTHALLPSSPAIDAVNRCGVTDQRGVPRPQDGDGDGVARCDIGAFEYVPPSVRVNQLIAHVESLNLPRGIEISLLVKLNAAALILGDMQEGNDHAAANLLAAFIRQVQAQYGKTIATIDADALIGDADQIIEMLSEDLIIRRPGFRQRAFSPGRRLGLNPQEPE